MTYTYSLAQDLSGKIASPDWFRVKASVTNDRRPMFITSQLFVHRNFDQLQFHQSSRDICDVPNAGGASEKSEALSFELLNRTFGARLLKTEMEIEYDWCISKRTDFLVLMFGRRLGVSVTRAMKFNPYRYNSHRTAKVIYDEEHYRFSYEDAMALLQKKLYGVLMSSRDVIERDSWGQQLLHIWAADHETATMLEQAYNDLKRQDPKLIANTIVLVTVAQRTDWIFTNRSTERETTSRMPICTTPRRFETLFPSRNTCKRLTQQFTTSPPSTTTAIPFADLTAIQPEQDFRIPHTSAHDDESFGLAALDDYMAASELQEYEITDEERYKRWQDKWSVCSGGNQLQAITAKEPHEIKPVILKEGGSNCTIAPITPLGYPRKESGVYLQESGAYPSTKASGCRSLNESSIRPVKQSARDIHPLSYLGSSGFTESDPHPVNASSTLFDNAHEAKITAIHRRKSTQNTLTSFSEVGIDLSCLDIHTVLNTCSDRPDCHRFRLKEPSSPAESSSVPVLDHSSSSSSSLPGANSVLSPFSSSCSPDQDEHKRMKAFHPTLPQWPLLTDGKQHSLFPRHSTAKEQPAYQVFKPPGNLDVQDILAIYGSVKQLLRGQQPPSATQSPQRSLAQDRKGSRSFNMSYKPPRLCGFVVREPGPKPVRMTCVVSC